MSLLFPSLLLYIWSYGAMHPRGMRCVSVHCDQTFIGKVPDDLEQRQIRDKTGIDAIRIITISTSEQNPYSLPHYLFLFLFQYLHTTQRLW